MYLRLIWPAYHSFDLLPLFHFACASLTLCGKIKRMRLILHMQVIVCYFFDVFHVLTPLPPKKKVVKASFFCFRLFVYLDLFSPLDKIFN